MPRAYQKAREYVQEHPEYYSFPKQKTLNKLPQVIVITNSLFNDEQIITSSAETTTGTKRAEQKRRGLTKTSVDNNFTESMNVTVPQEHFLANEKNKTRPIQLLSDKITARGIKAVAATGDTDGTIVRCGLEKAALHPAVRITGENVDLIVLLIAFARPRRKKKVVPEENRYLFTYVGMQNKWIKADVVIRKFALERKLNHPETIPITKDTYQTAKLSRLLAVFDQGKSGQYRGKSLDEIDLDDLNKHLNEEPEISLPSTNSGLAPSCNPCLNQFDKKAVQNHPEQFPDYCLRNDNLYRHFPPNSLKDEEASDPWNLCVASPFRTRVLHENHDTPTAGHLGITKTTNRIADRIAQPHKQDPGHLAQETGASRLDAGKLRKEHGRVRQRPRRGRCLAAVVQRYGTKTKRYLEGQSEGQAQEGGDCDLRMASESSGAIPRIKPAAPQAQKESGESVRGGAVPALSGAGATAAGDTPAAPPAPMEIESALAARRHAESSASEDSDDGFQKAGHRTRKRRRQAHSGERRSPVATVNQFSSLEVENMEDGALENAGPSTGRSRVPPIVLHLKDN
ncbi:hypothetical protein ILUMI_18864, partial [Ignelater luminosus]